MKELVNNGILIEMPKDKRDMESIVEFINTNFVKHIGIIRKVTLDSNSDSTSDLLDLSFLSFIKSPESIIELDLYFDCIDYTPIYRFINLEKLYINIRGKEAIDLARFSKLHKLSTNNLFSLVNLKMSSVKWLCYGSMTKKIECEIELLQQFNQLEDLRLFRINYFPINRLVELKKLKKVWFISCYFKELRGINEIKSLEFINFDNCRQLEQIDGIEQLPNLKVLWFESCSKIKDAFLIRRIKNLKVLLFESIKGIDFSFLENMECENSLECLMLENCGNIESIKFLDNYPVLQAFDCYKTNVIDGNISPCLRMESAWISNKKHYNLKSDQLPFGRSFYEWVEAFN